MGQTFTNTLALTGGNEMGNFRFSASNLDNKAVVPNSGLNKKSFSMNVNGRYWDKLTASAKVQYFIEDVDNRARLSDAPGNANYAVGLLPPSINVEDLKGTTDKQGAEEDGTELMHQSSIYQQNPWWAAYQFETHDKRDRIMGSTTLRFDFTDWLFLQGRMGMDWYTSKRTQITPYGTAYSPQGQMNERSIRQRETNIDFMLGFDKNFGDIGINGFFGGNQARRHREEIGASGSVFNIPFFHDISNLANIGPIHGLTTWGINSLYGSAEISFRDFLFVTGTAREDWFSTLDGRGLLYPSVGMSFVFSDAISLPEAITFGKVRASWAQVGGGTGPYQTNLTYGLVGQGHMGQALGKLSQGTIPNSELVPFTSTEMEFGADIRLFQNRLGLDVAYYTRTTTDDILNASISQASGFGSATVNIGEITNSGVEALVTGKILQGDLDWDLTVNFAYNTSEVVSLAEGIEVMQVGEARSRNAYIQHHLGKPYGLIIGYSPRTDDNGNTVYDANGLPLRSETPEILGYGVHPITSGITNAISYKGVNLSFLIDIKQGGDIYAGTNSNAYGRGLHVNTLEGRETGIDVSGVDEDGDAFNYHVEAEDLQDYWGRISGFASEFVADASFAKLRQFTIGYNLPSSVLNKTPFSSVNISVIGRNLAVLWKNVENIDPEANYQTGNAQGLEWFGVPQYRTFGFNVNVKF